MWFGRKKPDPDRIPNKAEQKDTDSRNRSVLEKIKYGRFDDGEKSAKDAQARKQTGADNWAIRDAMIEHSARPWHSDKDPKNVTNAIANRDPSKLKGNDLALYWLRLRQEAAEAKKGWKDKRLKRDQERAARRQKRRAEYDEKTRSPLSRWYQKQAEEAEARQKEQAEWLSQRQKRRAEYDEKTRSPLSRWYPKQAEEAKAQQKEQAEWLSQRQKKQAAYAEATKSPLSKAVSNFTAEGTEKNRKAHMARMSAGYEASRNKQKAEATARAEQFRENLNWAAKHQRDLVEYGEKTKSPLSKAWSELASEDREGNRKANLERLSAAYETSRNKQEAERKSSAEGREKGRKAHLSRMSADYEVSRNKQEAERRASAEGRERDRKAHIARMRTASEDSRKKLEAEQKAASERLRQSQEWASQHKKSLANYDENTKSPLGKAYEEWNKGREERIRQSGSGEDWYVKQEAVRRKRLDERAARKAVRQGDFSGLTDAQLTIAEGLVRQAEEESRRAFEQLRDKRRQEFFEERWADMFAGKPGQGYQVMNRKMSDLLDEKKLEQMFQKSLQSPSYYEGSDKNGIKRKH